MQPSDAGVFASRLNRDEGEVLRAEDGCVVSLLEGGELGVAIERDLLGTRSRHEVRSIITICGHIYAIETSSAQRAFSPFHS